LIRLFQSDSQFKPANRLIHLDRDSDPVCTD
jgi:hypothetical protein